MKKTADTANPNPIIKGGQCGDFVRSIFRSDLKKAYTWQSGPEFTAALNMMLNTPNASCIIWGNRQRFFFNDAFLQTAGFSVQTKHIGKPYKDVVGEINLDLTSLLKSGMNGYSQNIKNFKISNKENLQKSEILTNFTYSPLFEASAVNGVMFTAFEINSDCNTQNFYENGPFTNLLSDSSPILTATCRPDGGADYFSSNWLELLGCNLDTLVDYGWIDYIHPDDKEAFLNIYWEAVKTRIEWKGSFRIKSRSGSYHILASAGTPKFDQHKNFSGYISSSVDITEQQKAINKLQTSEAHLAAMIHDAPIGICLLDARSLVSEVVNSSFLEVAGKPYEQIAGKYYWDSFAEVKHLYQKALQGVVEKGESFYANEVEMTLIRHGRPESVFVTFVYAPLKDMKGNVIKVAVWVLENTLQVKARNQIEQSEREIRTFIDSAPFPIGVYKGPEMKIAFANTAIIEAWGKGPDVIGKSFKNLMPELENQGVFKNLDTAFAYAEPIHTKNELINVIVDCEKKSSYFNYSLIPLIDNTGNVYGVMNTAADVTELNLAKIKVEKSEQNLKNTILQAPVAMCIYRGPDYIVETANSRMLEFWGKEEQDVIGLPLFTALSEAKNQGFEERLESVYKSGQSVSSEGVSVTLMREGKLTTVYVNFLFEPFYEPDNSISGILVAAVDVTAQVLAHQKIEETVAIRTKELAESNENLSRSNSELSQFAYIASHDLQEPLRKISVFAQMLEKSAGEKLEGRPAEFLSKIKASSDRMSSLVRDVLAFSELSAKPETTKKVDLSAIIDSILLDYELLIGNKQAKVNCTDMPLIDAIPLQMNQLFANLLSNALKYASPERNLKIEISCSHPSLPELIKAGLDENISYIKITFADNGIGISPEYTDQIFSIFKRLHRRAEYEGTGVGLAICRKIAQNHSGAINAEGSTLSGAVFNIYLPTEQL
ncbi:PAS domain-containing protein [Flavobacterium limi]|uniref:histidine kinase n=1 Tax=Flavobacterium limi TaxID=2045105 RepID=A0ABQ1UYP2_9FLAO|nr:PAS domain-containing protein [Flavobacterium limi]GGF29517.1 hypothetical protein GCM10011518_43470 [Flavobacterium limi]